MSAHEVAAWVALALALLELAVIVAVVVLVVRFWRKVSPTVAPMLSMFAPPASPATKTEAAIAPARADADELRGELEELKRAEHDGGANPWRP